MPEAAHTEVVEDVIAWLGEIVRQTDSSITAEVDLAASDGAGTAVLPRPAG